MHMIYFNCICLPIILSYLPSPFSMVFFLFPSTHFQYLLKSIFCILEKVCNTCFYESGLFRQLLSDFFLFLLMILTLSALWPILPTVYVFHYFNPFIFRWGLRLILPLGWGERCNEHPCAVVTLVCMIRFLQSYPQTVHLDDFYIFKKCLYWFP